MTSDTRNLRTWLSLAMLKRFLLFFVPVTILLTVSIYLVYQQEVSIELRILKFREKNHVDLAQKRVEQMLKDVAAEVLIQAQHFVLLTWPDRPRPEDVSALTSEFVALMRNKKVYDQVRLLDLQGREVVRVNYGQGRIRIVPEKELQDKSGRYYFKEAIDLQQGEIYVSPFDLNVEQGEIELPIKPTIRFVTPVYDLKGRKRGLLVLNYLGAPILEMLKERAMAPARVMLLDEEGYWLLGPDPKDEWGFMYGDGKERRFSRDFPSAWSEVKRKDQGQFFTATGMFTFSTIKTPAKEGKAPRWKILFYVADKAVDDSLGIYLNQFLWLLAGLALLSALGSLVLARTQIRRRLSLEALAESEARNRSILVTAADGIITVDEKGIVRSFNPAAEEIFGYRAQEAIGLEVLMLFAESRRDRAGDVMKKYFEKEGVTEKNERQESIGLKKNGSTFPVEISASLAHWGGRPLLTGIIRDISERKQAEEKIALNAENQEVLNKLLRLSLEGGPLHEQLKRALGVIFSTAWLGALPKGGIFLKDKDDAQILHLVAQQELDPQILTMCSKVPFGRCHCGRAAAEGKIQYSARVDECHQNIYDGMEPHGHYNIPIMSKGRCLGVVLLYLPEGHERQEDEMAFLEAVGHTMAGLIESRLATEALEESEARIRTILNTAVEGVITCNADGIVQSFNPAAESIFGYKASEVIGQNVNILQPEPFRSRHDGYIKKYIETGVAKVIGRGRELVGRKKDGAEFPIYLSLSEVRIGDRIIFTAILRDITELKRAQAQLEEAKEEAEAANQELMAKQKHLDEDLKAAAEIQRTLLPRDLPRLKQLDLAWKFLPSEFVGGDIFNAFMLNPDHLAVYTLDVSGHGVPSALVTVSVHEMLDRQIRHECEQDNVGDEAIISPGRVLEMLDQEYPLERFGKSFTIAYLVLNIKTGRLVYSNAGHPLPMVLRPNGRIQTLEEGGTIIGLGGVVPFDEGEMQLESGDKIILYTDGVVEYSNPERVLFGEQRFRDVLAEHHSLPVSQILEKVWEALLAFGFGENPPDDISLLGLEFKGNGDLSP